MKKILPYPVVASFLRCYNEVIVPETKDFGHKQNHGPDAK